MSARRGRDMRKIIVVLTVLLMSGAWLSVAEASIARGGGGARPAVGNRSVGAGHANVNRGNVSGANINRGNVNRGNINRGAGNVNVNRGINNANINRNVNGWGNHNWTDDHNWGWGSFAGGAAAAATGAAVGAAVSHAAAPDPGTVVTAPPSGCAASTGAAYSCGGATYQPSFDG